MKDQSCKFLLGAGAVKSELLLNFSDENLNTKAIASACRAIISSVVQSMP